MNEFHLPEELRRYRPLLLALEAVGWLHMIGKAKVDFLRAHGGQGNYDYTRWHEQESPPFPWDDLLKWVKDKYPKNSSNIEWPDALAAFIREHAEGKSKPNLVGLLQAGHAMASGIEKQSFPENTIKYLGQDATHMWSSTAFGRPVRNLLADPPELLTDTGWKGLLEQIEGLLIELKRLGEQGSSNDLAGWWRWRDGAVGPDGWLRRTFTGTLAETRLPNNDVTLFDQSYVVAALFKSAAARAILEGGSFSWNDENLKQQTRWRLLTVGIGADHFETRAVKIGDWTGVRLALNDFFRKVRKLVEVDLAVGSLLYADGKVCVFSFPGEQFNHNSGDLQIEEWNKWLSERIDEFAKKSEFETPPYCSICEPSRSLVGMTAAIKEARETMAVPLHKEWEITGENPDQGHVCPVCLVRRSGGKSGKQTPCKTCKARRTGRLDSWLEGKFDTDTIWISELADANDRVALVTMSLDIEPWLDGTRLDALRTQAISEWRSCNPTLKRQPNPIDPNACFENLLQYIEEKLASFDKKDPVLCSLQNGYQHEKDWRSFFEKIVEDRAPNDQPEWKKDDSRHNARWLTHQLFRKLASPGRIYRFQRQAKDFFKELLAEFRKISAADRNHWRTRRLVIKPDNGSDASWEDWQTYNGRYGDAPISLLYRKKTDDFLTICNLTRLLKPEQGKDSLVGTELKLKADDRGWGKQTKKLKVKSVSDDAGTLGVYHTVIPLELSPVRFRVLMPLEAASDCVDTAIKAWNEQFARVWDKLPIKIGVIAFPRMTPFQAVIEGTRNVEADLTANRDDPEIWRVDGREMREGIAALDLVRPDENNELRTMPVKLRDGRKDVFYPYLAVEDKKLRFPLDFQHPDGPTYRHAKDLRSGDGVLVYPSLIATVFIDGTAKRFEPLSCRYFTEWRRMRDLWRLMDCVAPSQTALRGAWSELVERREAWQGPDLPAASAVQAGGAWLEGGKEVWLDLVRAVFHERLGVRGACLEMLVKVAGDGLLDWSLEWHMSVLKKQVSGGDQ